MTKKDKPEAIKFQAQVSKIATLVDGGVNITLSMFGKDIVPIMQLLKVQQEIGVILFIVALPIFIEKEVVKPKKSKDLGFEGMED